jgi:sortase A
MSEQEDVPGSPVSGDSDAPAAGSEEPATGAIAVETDADAEAAPVPPPRTRGAGVWHIIGWIGRSLITVGILILLFVVYQLWGTGIYTQQQQDSLRSKFNAELAHKDNPVITSTTKPVTTSSGVTTTTDGGTTSTAPATIPTPANGAPIAQIAIPKIGISFYVVEGTDRGDLMKGPGHYPNTPFPGQIGNSSIAGHRTTYLHPFFDLDQVHQGDLINLTTTYGKYQYKVTDQIVVAPTATYVELPTPNPAYNAAKPQGPGNYPALATITLTTCNPKYSASQRLVIKATLVEKKDTPAPLPPAPVKKSKSGKIETPKIAVDTGTSSTEGPAQSILWGTIVAIIGALWFFAFRKWRKWYTWFVGVVPFLFVLFFLYTHVERLLPATY